MYLNYKINHISKFIFISPLSILNLNIQNGKIFRLKKHPKFFMTLDYFFGLILKILLNQKIYYQKKP